MKLLKGKIIADKILSKISLEIKGGKIAPVLAVILIGKNKASETYVELKEKAARKVGIGFYLFRFSEKSKESEIIQKIKELNRNKEISGIIVQLPLPGKFNAQKIINAIDPKKDADGFHPENIKLFLQGKGSVDPVFPKAIVKMIESVNVDLKGKKAIVVANSEKFGRTMKVALGKDKISAEYLLQKNFKKYFSVIALADIIISAIGNPGVIKSGMVKKGAIVVDGGIAKKGKKVLGDVNFDSVKNVAGYLSPVPGGVGPVTVACLLENVYLLSKKSPE